MLFHSDGTDGKRCTIRPWLTFRNNREKKKNNKNLKAILFRKFTLQDRIDRRRRR